MNNPSIKFIIITGLGAGWVTSAMALESPPDDAPPPAEVAAPDAAASAPKPLRFGADEAQVAASAFLGVVSSELPDMLAEHLGLQANQAIMVRSLVPDGPAAKAGIAIHDVITRVGTQDITSPAVLSQCIASKKPGETITMELIHQGKPTKVDITLGNRPADLAAEPQTREPFNLEELPDELADRIRGAIEGNLGGLDLQLGEDAGPLRPQMENALRELKKRMGGGLLLPEAPAERGIQLHSGASFRMNDPEGSIEVKTSDGGKEVTIRDNADQVIWSGPWDTAQDKAAAPETVRKRVESLNLDTNFNGNGLRLQMRQQPAPPADD